jgi:ABC-type Fe3+/spermidine/putrescine transport system ATPase subunit
LFASGSGKTTLLEILAGFADKTGGTIHWRDQELTVPAPATIRRNRFSVS